MPELTLTHPKSKKTVTLHFEGKPPTADDVEEMGNRVFDAQGNPRTSQGKSATPAPKVPARPAQTPKTAQSNYQFGRTSTPSIPDPVPLANTGLLRSGPANVTGLITGDSNPLVPPTLRGPVQLAAPADRLTENLGLLPTGKNKTAPQPPKRSKPFRAATPHDSVHARTSSKGSADILRDFLGSVGKSTIDGITGYISGVQRANEQGQIRDSWVPPSIEAYKEVEAQKSADAFEGLYNANAWAPAFYQNRILNNPQAAMDTLKEADRASTDFDAMVRSGGRAVAPMTLSSIASAAMGGAVRGAGGSPLMAGGSAFLAGLGAAGVGSAGQDWIESKLYTPEVYEYVKALRSGDATKHYGATVLGDLLPIAAGQKPGFGGAGVKGAVKNSLFQGGADVLTQLGQMAISGEGADLRKVDYNRSLWNGALGGVFSGGNTRASEAIHAPAERAGFKAGRVIPDAKQSARLAKDPAWKNVLSPDFKMEGVTDKTEVTPGLQTVSGDQAARYAANTDLKGQTSSLVRDRATLQNALKNYGLKPMQARDEARVIDTVFANIAKATGKSTEQIYRERIAGITQNDGSRKLEQALLADLKAEGANTEGVSLRGSVHDVAGLPTSPDTVRKVITALHNPNQTTVTHEFGHIFSEILPPAERATVDKWIGKPFQQWNREEHERFAVSYEHWRATDEAPTPGMRGIFERFRKWTGDIMERVSAAEKRTGVKNAFSPEVRDAIRRLHDTTTVPKARKKNARASRSITATGNTEAVPTGEAGARRSDTKTGRAGTNILANMEQAGGGEQYAIPADAPGNTTATKEAAPVKVEPVKTGKELIDEENARQGRKSLEEIAKEAEESASKPWQSTKAEYVKSNANDPVQAAQSHAEAVSEAVRAGEDVPAAVLADYPNSAAVAKRTPKKVKQLWELSPDEFKSVRDDVKTKGTVNAYLSDWGRTQDVHDAVNKIVERAGTVEGFRAAVVAKALSEGKKVPTEILAEFPELNAFSRDAVTTSEPAPEVRQEKHATTATRKPTQVKPIVVDEGGGKVNDPALPTIEEAADKAIRESGQNPTDFNRPLVQKAVQWGRDRLARAKAEASQYKIESYDPDSGNVRLVSPRPGEVPGTFETYDVNVKTGYSNDADSTGHLVKLNAQLKEAGIKQTVVSKHGEIARILVKEQEGQSLPRPDNTLFQSAKDDFPANETEAVNREYERRLAGATAYGNKYGTKPDTAAIRELSERAGKSWYAKATAARDSANNAQKAAASKLPAAKVEIAGSLRRGDFYAKGDRTFDIDLHVSGAELPASGGKDTVPLSQEFKQAIAAAKKAAGGNEVDVFVTHEGKLWVVDKGNLSRKPGAFGKEQGIGSNGIRTTGRAMSWDTFQQSFYKDLGRDSARPENTLFQSARDEQENTPEFRKFFEGSKAVDENGKPQVFYHGTDSHGFDTFSTGKDAGANLYGPGFYFTDDPYIASTYQAAKGRPEYRQAKGLKSLLPELQKAISKSSADANSKARLKNQLDSYKASGSNVIGEMRIDALAKQFEAVGIDSLGLFERDRTHGTYETYLSVKNPAMVEGKLTTAIASKLGDAFTKLYDTGGNDIASHFASMVEKGATLEDALKYAHNTVRLKEGAEGRSSYFGVQDYRDVLKAAGFDGIEHTGGLRMGNEKHRVMIAFEPNQIKSATNNSGAFDANNPSMLFQSAPDTPEFKKFFEGSKVVDEQGKPLVVYHGSPDAGFTEFKEGQFFTSNPEYAWKYTNTNASSTGSRPKKGDSPGVYPVYLSIKKPFDTRIPENRKVFEQEYYRKFGLGSPLSKSGLPDWSEARDLVEWIQEEGKDFDGVIVDEGGNPDTGSHGVSYVPLRPEQIKSAIGNRGTFDPTDPNILHQSAKDDDPFESTPDATPNLPKKEPKAVKPYITPAPASGQPIANAPAIPSTPAETAKRNVPAALEFTSNVFNTWKQAKASGDLSFVGRQGFILGVNYPKEAVGAAKELVAALAPRGGQESAERLYDAIRNDPDYKEAIAMGVDLHLTEIAKQNAKAAGESDLGARDEQFSSDWLGKLPVFKQLERANVAYLDTLRYGVYKNMRAEIVKARNSNKSGDIGQELQAVARYVNHATGRGDFPAMLESMRPILNGALFSPRFTASRFQVLADPRHYSSLTPAARKIAIRNNIRYAGTVMAMMGLAKAAGAQVSLNPDDADFLKIKFGDRRIEPSAGVITNLRMVLRVARAVARGDEGKRGGPQSAQDIFGQWFRNKLSPVGGIVSDRIAPKYSPEKYARPDRTVGEKALDAFGPIILTQFIDTLKEYNGGEAAKGAAMDFIGESTSIYKDKAKPSTSSGRSSGRGQPNRSSGRSSGRGNPVRRSDASGDPLLKFLASRPKITA